MTLFIRKVELRNFRNYESFSLDGLGDLTILVGRNAAGKTNVVESLQLLTSCMSFRHPKIEHLIKEGQTHASASMLVTDGSRELEYVLSLTPGKRAYRLNGKAKRTADLKGIVPSVTFTPDDLSIVKGGNAARRDLLDDAGSQISRNHHQIKKDYDQVLRAKNRLLKDGASADYLASLDEMVIMCGAQLAVYRAALFARMAPYICEHYRQIANSRDILSVKYEPSWCADRQEAGGVSSDAGIFEYSLAAPCEKPSFDRDGARAALADALQRRRFEEVARKRALVGPHADAISFTLDGKDAAVFGSQGQQRTIVLALKLAEVDLIEDVLGQRPVLLLDDVMSELDEARRDALTERITQGVQTFVTTTNLSYFSPAMIASARVVRLGEEDRS